MFTRSRCNSQGTILGYQKIAFCALLALVSACTSVEATTFPANTPNIPSNTNTSTAAQEPTHIVTPRLTFTPTPAPKWVIEFAAPILADIANRPPDIEDNFDQRSRAWIREDYCIRRVSFEDGEMVITECDVYHSGMNFRDYVIEVDGHFLQGTNPETSNWGIEFRNRICVYEIWFRGTVEVGCQYYQGGKKVVKHLDFGFPDFGGYQNNRLLLIVKDTRFAFYLNGRPIGYFKDEAISTGGIRLGLRGGDTPDTMAAFDNFKAWDITDLEIP